MATLRSVNRLMRKASFKKAKRYQTPSAYARRQLRLTLEKFFKNRTTEFKAITELWKRPYWTRVWIIQEIAISRRTLFLCCSHQSEDVEVALLAISAFASFKAYTSEELPRPLSMGDIYLINRQPEFMKITKLAQQLQKHFLYQLLFYCHGGSHSYKAFDPRDYVYGILGLAADRSSIGIVVDYEKSPEMVYDDVFRKVVTSDYTDVLALAVAKKTIANLLSWVPDFSNIGKVYFCTFNTVQVERHGNPIISNPEDRESLALRGLTIGVITKIAPETSHFEEGDGTSFGPLLQWLLAVGSELLLSPTEEEEQLWNNPRPIVIATPRSDQDRGRIARALFANMDPSTGVTIDDPRHAELFYQLIRSYINHPAGFQTRLMTAEVLRDVDAIGMKLYLSGVVGQALKGCRVYRLDTGHIGLASPGCRVGDKVMEIPGGSFPLVLRKAEDNNVNSAASEDAGDSFPSDKPLQSYNLGGMAWLDWMECWKLYGAPPEEHFILY
jgi:hypothetical protein